MFNQIFGHPTAHSSSHGKFTITEGGRYIIALSCLRWWFNNKYMYLFPPVATLCKTRVQYTVVSVTSGYCNKLPPTGRFEITNVFSHSSRGQDVGRAGLPLGALGPQCSSPFPASGGSPAESFSATSSRHLFLWCAWVCIISFCLP